MMESAIDQAAGLRRMFRASPPQVMTILPCGSGATPWVARYLQSRARIGLSILALDEWAACGNLADALGISPRFDLLQVIEGFVDMNRCQVPVTANLNLAPVARLSRALGQDRLTLQRSIEGLRSLQRSTDEWVIHARPCDLSGLSPLALAAPHLLLAVDPSPRAVTEAYTSLKRMQSCADTVSLGLTMTGKPTAETRALAANLQSVAQRQLGINLPLLEEPSQLFAMHSAAQERQAVSPYFERIQSLARQTAVMHGARRSLR